MKGIPEESREKLFAPFSQGDQSSSKKYGGTGLGLVISRNLVRMMHGDLWFDPTIVSGSRFFISIHTKAAAEPEVTPPRGESSSGQSASGGLFSQDFAKKYPLKILVRRAVYLTYGGADCTLQDR